MVFGIEGFGFNFNVSAIYNTVLTIVVLVGVLIFAGGVGFFLYKRKKDKLTIKKKIGWWEEDSGRLVPRDMDEAIEIVIPGTRLRVFYIKKKDMWLPRFTRGITPDLYYVCITTKRELVNFTLKSLDKQMAEAGLNYDHTDMIWASENIREFVKRNYRDKAVPWWQAYQTTITIIAYTIIVTISFCVILYMMRKIVGDLGGVVNQVSELVKTAGNQCRSSGIVTQ